MTDAMSGVPSTITARSAGTDARRMVASTMNETSRWMDEHASFFDSLTGDPSLNPVAELPSMPPVLEEAEEENAPEETPLPERVSE